LQAQTLQALDPVWIGEFSSAAAGEFDVPAPPVCPVDEDEEDVTDEDEDGEVPDAPAAVVLSSPSPGDCPGGM
jgi:hypothetical protein